MTEPDRESEIYDGDFYEEDEPIEKIVAILARGFDGVTAPPDEAVEGSVTVNDSPWVQRVHTATRWAGRAERQKATIFRFHLTGAASS
jgi:hypothetical protein